LKLDITEAVSAAQKAVKLTPPGDLYLPRRLISLGRSFFHRFKSTNDLGDITNAISAAEKAVQLTPAGHPHLLSMFSTLGRLFFFRFEHTSDPSDIAEAISAGQKAVKLSPPGHPDLPVLHFNLGNSLFRHSVDNLDASISHYMSAATSTFGPPSHRLTAAKCWAELLYDQCPKSPQTFAAFSTAIGLVSLVAGLEKTVQRRHAQLQGTSGLPLLAAAAACVLEQADKAVEWLEQGRCLVWAQLNNLRTPLDNLYMQNKDLAQQISDVSRQLENASSRQGLLHINMSISEQISVEDEARAHLGLAKKWDYLLNTVRSTIPGFENFLQPSPCSTLLQHLPDSGHVVIINVHETRCDALLLMAGWGEPHHIPLPNFSLKKANVYCHDLTAHLRSHQLRMQAVESGGSDTEDAPEQLGRTIRPGTLGRSHRKNVVQSILKGLWIDLVKPILDALGLSVSDCFY
jgi:tetratricopeptide (TPR) repeat protein